MNTDYITYDDESRIYYYGVHICDYEFYSTPQNTREYISLINNDDVYAYGPTYVHSKSLDQNIKDTIKVLVRDSGLIYGWTFYRGRFNPHDRTNTLNGYSVYNFLDKLFLL